MEGLTRLRSSRKGYCSHVTRILSKVEGALAKDVDELTVTYLTTAITQLEKKYEQIADLDREIMELIEDPSELEDTIMDSEEIQDLIMENINVLNKRVELLSRPTPAINTVSSHQDTDEDTPYERLSDGENVITMEPINVNVSNTSTTSTCNTPTISDAPMVYTTTTTVANTDFTRPSSTPLLESVVSTIPLNPLLASATSVSVSSFSYPSVSYIHSSGPPIPVATTVEQYEPLPTFTDVPLLPPMSTLNLGASGPPNPTIAHVVPPRTGLSLTGVMPTPTAVDQRNQAQQFAVSRLPKLTLPTFSGNILDWLTFWDSFQAAIHLNPNLSGVQKFNYLKAQLQGDAARTVEGFPLSDQNYLHAVTILQDRFGQTHKLVAAHMRALLDIPVPSNALNSLRMFHDTIESHSRGLSSLGKSEDTYGDLLVPIILGKLPKNTRQNLARVTTTPEWTFTQLMSAILREIRILETGGNDSYRSHSTAAFLINSTTPQSNKGHDRGSRSCVFCKGPHAANQCTTITDHQKRLDIVKRNHLCFNCLARHKVSQCTSKFRCRLCKRKHHTSLCNAQQGPTSTSIAVNNSQGTQQPPNHQPVTTQAAVTPVPVSLGSFLTPALHSNLHATSVCLLKIAVAPVVNGHTKIHANILFDEGAQRTFISTQLAAELQVTPTSTTQVALSSFGANSKSLQTIDVATVQVETLDGELIPISALIVSTISTPIHNSCHLPLNTLPHLKGLKLANPNNDTQEFTISILIGTDYYWSFVQDRIIRGAGPTAQQSKLGYLLSGPVPQLAVQSSTSVLLQITTLADDQQFNPQELWSIEAIGTNPILSNGAFLRSYQSKNISQIPNGTYIARFPWKEDKPYLPSNLTICTRRTKSLVTKLRRHPELLKLYDSIIKEQERRGFIERVDNDDASNTSDVHYLSHHAVKKDSQTTPIRIVYDCSCRNSTNTASLNDCLTVGPPFINDLCAILLRFRSYPFALSTDIEKAFLHVKLHQADRDFTRFLWPRELECADSDLQVYRFASVPFSTASSPFMLHATIDLHLHKFKSPVAKDIRKNIYVDNIISGCTTED